MGIVNQSIIQCIIIIMYKLYCYYYYGIDCINLIIMIHADNNKRLAVGYQKNIIILHSLVTHLSLDKYYNTCRRSLHEDSRMILNAHAHNINGWDCFTISIPLE